jgi:hypothetical protein
MNTIDSGNILKTKWNLWKTKMYDLTRKGAIRELKARKKVLRNIQGLNMPIIEKSPRIEQMKKERRTEWTPQAENIDNGFVDMRGKYVQRTQLFWTGVYGKEPWPRERKVWEKV